MKFFARWQEDTTAIRVDECGPARHFATALSREPRMTWGIFLLLLVLIFFRAPMLLLEPRLWAEEASLFLRYAYTHSFLESLTFVPPRLGYFPFVINVPTALAAHVFPLEYAPAVTTYFALGIVLALFALILWGRSYVWETRGKKSLACLIILFAPSSTGEVWLNSTNAQVYCGIIAACLLLEDLRTVSPCRRWAYRLLLFFCGLSGVYTTFLGGMFLVKAWLEKSREALIHVGLVACASLIQLTVFLQLYFSNSISEKRLVSLSLGKAVQDLFLHQLILPVIGSQWGRRLYTAFSVLVPTSEDTLVASVAWLTGILAVSYLLVSLYALVSQARQYSRNRPDGGERYPYSQLLLLGCYVSTAIGTTTFSLHGVPSGRYAVASGVFLLLILLNNLRPPVAFNLRFVCSAGILAGALVIGAIGYRTTGAQRYFVCGADCPKWADELKHCELTSECVVTVWPYPRWKFSWPSKPTTATHMRPVTAVS